MHYDEKYVKVKKKDCYDLNAIDSKTKYVLAHLFVEKRTIWKCTEFLRQIKITCYRQILEKYIQEKDKPKSKRKLIIFVCDKFGNYKAAFDKLFYRVAKLRFGIPIKAKKNGLKHNNNHIERYNQDIKDRIKTMRNFGSNKGAEYFLNLKHIIHNFVNPHMQINGKTPAEAAEIDLNLGRRKLLNLIRRCSKNKHHSLR
ncbi:MAG: DDE-type integrase/transposase/recombinase [Nanoarchaeota archaeon]